MTTTALSTEDLQSPPLMPCQSPMPMPFQSRIPMPMPMPYRSLAPTSTPTSTPTVTCRSLVPTPLRCLAPTIQFPPAATQNLASSARMQQYPAFVAPASQFPVPTPQFTVPSYRPLTPTSHQSPVLMPCPTQYSPAATQYPGFAASMLCRPPAWIPCRSPAPIPCQSRAPANQCPAAQYPATRPKYPQFVAPPPLRYPVFTGMPQDSPMLPESLAPTVGQYTSARVYTEMDPVSWEVEDDFIRYEQMDSPSSEVEDNFIKYNFQVAKRKCTQEDTTTLRTIRRKLNMNEHTNKLERTCFKSVFGLETEDSAPVDVYCNKRLNRFCSALQTVSNQEMVFSRIYGKNEGAQVFFDKLKSIKHENILEPLMFLENDVSEVITFPSVQCTLHSYIEMNSDILWNRSTQNSEGSFKPKLIDILRTVAKTIEFIHTNNLYHGPLHVDDIYMAFKDEPRNAVVKLVLSGFETECKVSWLLLDPVLHMRRKVDWKGFQKLVVEVVGLLDPIYMQKLNGRNEIIHLANQNLGESPLNYVLESPALLTTEKKVMLMLCLNNSKFQEQYAGKMCQEWTMKFSNVLSSIDKTHNIYCGSTQSNEAAPLNSMASFLRFCYNMIFHFIKLTPATKLHLGGSIETALQQFEKVYPGLFVDIVEYLRSEELLETFLP